MLKVALRFIWYDKPKAYGILFGIILSIFLIGQNIGIGVSLLESTISLARNNGNYIWVANNKTKQVSELAPIDMRIARELMSVKGVKRVSPMVVAAGIAKFSDGTKGAISVIGVDTKTFAGGPWRVSNGSTDNLLQSGAYKKAVQTQLVSNIASIYNTLMAYDAQLQVTLKTVENRKRSVTTIKQLKESDVVTGAAVVQSEANLYSVEVTIPDLKQYIRETENALSILSKSSPVNPLLSK